MKPKPTNMTARMHPLPRRHRIAHLRALIRQQPAGSVRGQELAALLRGEVAAQSPGKERAGEENDSSIKSRSFKE